jgi:hypothetical protein
MKFLAKVFCNKILYKLILITLTFIFLNLKSVVFSALIYAGFTEETNNICDNECDEIYHPICGKVRN